MSTDQTAEPSSRCAQAPARSRAHVELIAIVLLALSTLIAVTAVSIGIARADLFGTTYSPK